VGSAAEIAEQLYAHPRFQQVREVVFALPFSFDHDDYVQILTDIAGALDRRWAGGEAPRSGDLTALRDSDEPEPPRPPIITAEIDVPGVSARRNPHHVDVDCHWAPDDPLRRARAAPPRRPHLIYASFTFIFFALEGSIMAQAFQLGLGIPLPIGYIITSVLVIPIVIYGM
jgi:hypothetical protein